MSEKNDNPQSDSNEYISRYKVIAKLGEGGMVKVYKAHDPALDKTFARKVLGNSKSISEQYQIRFQNEAKTLKNLKHSAIPEVYNFAFSRDGDPYLVMEYIDGKSLRELIKEKGRLDLALVLTITMQVCEALTYAHKNGVIHRDIKPENIIVANDDPENPDIKLIDFGISKIEQELTEGQDMTQTGVIVGSPNYINPEQIRGLSADQRSDIYSLGCVLFEMITGEPPFVGSNALNTLSKHLEVPVSTVLDCLPENLKDTDLLKIIERAIMKDPSDRFQSADEFRQHLAEYQISLVMNDEEEMHAVVEKNEAPLLPNQSSPEIRAKWPIVLLLLGVFALTALVIYGNFSPKNVEPIRSADSYNPQDEIINILSTEYFGRKNRNGFVYNKQDSYWIAGEDITDEDFKKLAEENLKPNCIVRIEAPDKVTGSGIKYLLDSPIAWLVIASANVTDEALINAGKMKSLRYLSVGMTKRLTLDGIRKLTANQGIVKIALRNINLPAGTVNELSRLKNLNSIRLDGSKNVTRQELNSLTKVKGLKSLYLGACDIDKNDLEILSNLDNLFELSLESLELNDEDILKLKGIKVKKLGLGGNKITDKAIFEIAKIKNLKELKIYNFKASPSTLNFLKERNITLIDEPRLPDAHRI